MSKSTEVDKENGRKEQLKHKEEKIHIETQTGSAAAGRSYAIYIKARRFKGDRLDIGEKKDNQTGKYSRVAAAEAAVLDLSLIHI